MSIKHIVIHFGGKYCADKPSGGYEVTDYIGGENEKFKDVDGEYICYMNLLNAITETVDHKCGKAFFLAESKLELHCISKGKIVVINSDNVLTGVWHNTDEDPTGSIHFFVFIISLASSVPGTPRVMHGTLERDPNNMANLPRKKTLAKKTVPRNKVVRLGSVVGDVNMSQVMGDMTVSQVMGGVTVSQVMGDVTIGSDYVGENVISKKKKRLRPGELPEEELDHLPLFYVSDNIAGDNVEVVGKVPIWEEGLVENECIATWSFQYDTKQWTGTCLAFKASLDGFVNGCRPVLGLDGCFLKGKYGGQCLSIVAMVGHNGLFPIAIYLCRYCSEYHMVSSYVKTYSGSVLAISDPSLWDKTMNIEVLPPPFVRGLKTSKGPPTELRTRGSQPITRVRAGGRPRGNRPRDSFGPRSGVTSELPTQPTVLTPRGRGGRGTDVRGRGNSQTGRSGSGITEVGRGNIAVIRGGRGITQDRRGRRDNTTIVRGESGNTQARRGSRGNTAVVRDGKGNTAIVRGGRGTTSLSQEPIIPTQGRQTSKQPPNNPYKKLFRPPKEVWLI
ncbi:hypothetical protein GIB67_030535 [Kingdonia uniflora]|uniref:Uncharacterized protein n=1 Tax=Kingdonia uniflora TaxID=39325 RepID=A0A7J7L4X3_9MAGN|nr:hypothetical protein GIB67_030535 [Kingdonia uniflora]